MLSAINVAAGPPSRPKTDFAKGLSETEIGHYVLEVRSWKLEVGIGYEVAIRRLPSI